VPSGRPLGSVQLHNLLLVGDEEPGQPGAVAADALDRPHPPTVVAVGEPQQLPIAGRGAGTVTCSSTAPVAVATTAAVWVCRELGIDSECSTESRWQ
jgi:hypothetical protein